MDEILGRRELMDRCAEASGLTPEQCDAAFEVMIERFAKSFNRGRRVWVDGFGIFSARRQDKGVGFMPNNMLLERLKDAPVTRRIRRRRNPDALPLRTEDEALIETWIRDRAVAAKSPKLFGAKRRSGRKQWIGVTPDIASGQLKAFARRCDVPLDHVGLTTLECPEETHPTNREIVLYARRYEEQSRARLAPYAHLEEEFGNLTFRTPWWNNFLWAGGDFYDWLEATGQRPRGYHPLRDPEPIQRFPPLHYNSKRKIQIVLEWYQKVLAAPELTPMERAYISLLANSLRASEAGRVMIEDIDFRDSTVTVLQKGGVINTIRILDCFMAPVKAYLETRPNSASPYLFLMKRSHPWGRKLVIKACRKVHDDPIILSVMRPHKFRHYFCSMSKVNGMPTRAAMRITGHRQESTFDRYVTTDEPTMKEAMAHANKQKWF